MTFFGAAARETRTHRLANLVLLSRIKNTELSNREFDEKRKKYFKSSVNIFPNVVKVMQYTDWTPQVLEERQEQLLDVLVQRFK
ncbi:MAG: HNH endonuclease family protein [Singulisphaera sp.]